MKKFALLISLLLLGSSTFAGPVTMVYGGEDISHHSPVNLNAHPVRIDQSIMLG